MSNKLLFNQVSADKVTYLSNSPKDLAVIDVNFNCIELEKVDDSLYYKILKVDNYSKATKIFSHRTHNDGFYFIKNEKQKFVYFIAIIRDSNFLNKIYNLRKSIHNENNAG